MRNLIQKYAVAAPRYTSYPSFLHWEGAPTQKDWFESIGENPEIDLYLHIPYCEKLCLYCGCNREITRNHELEKPYLELLLKELDLYLEKLGSIKVNNIHFGGGTPTFISPSNFDWFLGEVFSKIEKGPHFCGSFEADPRVTEKEHFETFQKYGFDRVSFGIQDFAETVQKVIGRIQPFALVKEKVELARENGFKSINFDVIYGLPEQSLETIQSTFDKVSFLSPDTIAFFSYAHVPWKIRHQKALEKYDLPKGKEKYDLKELGERRLRENGYAHIGLDHFVKKTDPLYKAYEQGLMKRNFMGYTIAPSPSLIGLGQTSISTSPSCYIQNKKDASGYRHDLLQGRLAIENGHQLSTIDKTVGEAISLLLCKGHLDLKMVSRVFDRDQMLYLFDRIGEFEKDGLLQRIQKDYFLTEKGKIFSRNIAMALDVKLHTGLKSSQFSNSL